MTFKLGHVVITLRYVTLHYKLFSGLSKKTARSTMANDRDSHKIVAG